jgi:hypothetical protein
VTVRARIGSVLASLLVAVAVVAILPVRGRIVLSRALFTACGGARAVLEAIIRIRRSKVAARSARVHGFQF